MKRITIIILLLLIALLFLWAAYLDGVVALASYDVEIPDGAYGLWECPELGTYTPLYFSDKKAQRIVDQRNSAVIRIYDDGLRISDHADSLLLGGRWNVNNMKVGGSAFLHKADGTQEYTCIAILLCDETHEKLYKFQGMDVHTAANDLICVSCANDDGSQVYVAYYVLTALFR